MGLQAAGIPVCPVHTWLAASLIRIADSRSNPVDQFVREVVAEAEEAESELVELTPDEVLAVVDSAAGGVG